MEYLNLKDLDISALNYATKGPGLREWLLASLEFYPRSFLTISKKAGIEYQTLLRYVHRKTEHMNYRNMLLLKEYIESLMKDHKDVSFDVNLEKENFFNS